MGGEMEMEMRGEEMRSVGYMYVCCGGRRDE